MLKGKIYLSGAMSGLPELNYPEFNRVAKLLCDRGLNVVNPAELVSSDLPWEQAMRKDIALLLECEAIAVMPGWKSSRGATLEVHIAKSLGMPVYNAFTMENEHES